MEPFEILVTPHIREQAPIMLTVLIDELDRFASLAYLGYRERL